MYDIALSVQACLRAATQVDVAWVVQTRGFSSRDSNQSLALTPGGGKIGAVMDGSLNDQLADAATNGRSGHVLELTVSDLEAAVAGLSCGGLASVALMSAADLPAGLWDALRDREPVLLVATLDGDTIVETSLYTAETVAAAGEQAERLFARRTSASTVSQDQIVTAFWPVPGLVVVGGGSIADALVATSGVLGWNAQVANDASTAIGLVARLAGIDKIVVLSHDLEVAGPALEAALAGPVGYIGALGSRRTQQNRADWLAYRGVTDIDRIHGPAGLDIGANTPAEIAIAIVAEALAAQAGKDAPSLRERVGSIHG